LLALQHYSKKEANYQEPGNQGWGIKGARCIQYL